MEFSLESHYNPHLPTGAEQLHTVLTVSAQHTENEALQLNVKKVFGYLLDISGSMSGEKLLAAKLALHRQLDLLAPDDWFFIVTFTKQACVLVSLMQASDTARYLAHGKIHSIDAGGGTAMSGALLAARAQFIQAGEALGYAQFVTDGQNDSADRAALGAAIERCQGVFQCDAWGVGADWEPAQLKEIAHALLGSADAVPEAQQLETMFRQAQQRAAARGVGAVQLRLQLPKSVRIVSIRQQAPEILDLTRSILPSADTREFIVPLGAWAPETRDYYVVMRLEPQAEGEQVMAMRAWLDWRDQGVQRSVESARVIATWTADTGLSMRIHAQVAHATGQQELAVSIREGLEAKERGDLDQATLLLGRAARLAQASGNDEVTRRLAKVVDIVSAEQGTVRLKSGTSRSADLELDLGGTRTVRRRATSTLTDTGPSAPA